MKFRRLLGLSLKNLARYSRRTIITASAVAAGIMMFILVDSILKGAEMESERNLIWYETGSGSIFTRDYWEEKDRMPLNKGIMNPKEVFSFLEKQEIKFTPRISFPGELVVYKDPYPEDGSLQIYVVAIDPIKDTEVFHLKESLVKGAWFSSKEVQEGVIIGAWLAESLGAQVGYPVTISTRTHDGAYQTFDLPIIGILSCNNPVVNRTGVYIPLDLADLMLNMEGKVTSIAINIPEYLDFETKVSELKSLFSSKFPDLVVVPWKDLAPGYVAIAEAKRGSTSLILLFLFVIAAVGISNTMLMAVYERFREIGMMRALGMKESQIRLSFLMEAAGIGFLGALIGIILSLPLNYLLVKYGIDYTWLTRQMDIGYRVAGAFKGTWNISSFVTGFSVCVILATFVALFPVRRAFKKNIVDCLHYQ